MNAQHAAPKTPRADRSNVVQTRPPTEDAVPPGPDAPDLPTSAQTQIMDAVFEAARLPVQHAAPPAEIVPEHASAPAEHWTPEWRRGGVAQQPEYRGVAVGVPGPDSVFLDPSKIDFQTWAADWLADTSPVVQAKAQEYGSNSLMQQGRRYARGQKRDVAGIEAMEIGCWSYAAGKMDRVEDAIQRRDLPGRDSWHDIAVYALMVLYMREVGRWP